MVSKSTLRVTIDVHGVPRSIISIGEHRSSGELTINIKAATRMRDIGQSIYGPGLSDIHRLNIVSQKYSIHPSLMSQTGNQLHHTLIVEGKPNISMHHWTKAIKTTNKFALLFARSHPDLTNEKYAVERNLSINQSLGSYDPTRYTLVTFVAVARKGRVFKHPNKIFNVYQRDFSRFSIVLLWGFMTAGSSENGSLCHVLTQKPEEEADERRKAAFESTIEGYDENECIINCLNLFDYIVDDLKKANVFLINSRPPGFSFSGERDE